MGELRMPSLGADMDAGTLVEWKIGPGSRVARGEIVALVETQKGIIEIEIWESGFIGELLVRPGSKVPVGTALATVQPAAALAPAAPAPAAPAPAAPVPVPAAPSPDGATRTANGAGAAVEAPAPSPAPLHVRASPAARLLARELAVDLRTVSGTGPHEAVTRADVDRAAKARSAAAPAAPPRNVPAAPATRPAPAARVEGAAASQMRKAIAAAMARSKREIPHYYLGADVDASRAMRWLAAENARRPVTERLLPVALLLKATALALREVPELNGHYVDEGFRPGAGIHVGAAIALRGGGLVAPAIHDTDDKSVPAVMAALSDLVARARAGSLRSSEMTDPTITVTSLGDQGTDAVFGVIYPPQVALVGFGTIRERPWAEAGMLGVRPVIHASLAADHRVTDGHRGARFLATVARLLSAPEKL